MLSVSPRRKPAPFRPRVLAATLLLGLGLARCRQAPPPPEAEGTSGRLIRLEGGTSFLLPAAYHEVTAASGRTFRLRGGAKQSYGTLHVQRRAAGQALGLDETFSLLLARLAQQENFDLSSLELHACGDTLCLVYAAKFSLLDVPRRQWGVLIDGADGITALLMTAPQDSFAESSLDFANVLQSLDHQDPPAKI